MHRRKRIRKQMMPSPMEIDGAEGGGAKMSTPMDSNIEILTKKLQTMTVKKLSDAQKKKKKPKYIDTSKLLSFKREVPKRNDSESA